MEQIPEIQKYENNSAQVHFFYVFFQLSMFSLSIYSPILRPLVCQIQRSYWMKHGNRIASFFQMVLIFWDVQASPLPLPFLEVNLARDLCMLNKFLVDNMKIQIIIQLLLTMLWGNQRLNVSCLMALQYTKDNSRAVFIDSANDLGKGGIKEICRQYYIIFILVFSKC